ncbi:DUF2891 domain-containing protein [Cytophagaceae bacterium DM2B3-1]|uniref:DUF2891 domain-containing protein n=1 Tax=Xanthocytophaga flava TaxID=3048013 RepID=A0ABT7CJW6_9BACT|nr:DUF2891 domain-containing protein [Xanthocytophaga flavus]MDJ1494040.1 DUF2891 domain-containing protein [Xanthocytophaga flavus]
MNYSLVKAGFFGLLFLLQITYSSAQSSLFTPEIASRLAALPIHCIHQEFPNKTGHSSDAPEDHRLLPSELHPSFYGCLDWHSSVHGHWMLVKLLKLYPQLPEKDQIIQILNTSFDPAKIKIEADYFTKYKTTRSFERTYGWAWLLKLDEELYTWDTPQAKQWHHNLQPLTQTILKLWTDFLPKQTYPNRTGVHPNTAFGLVFALDWARAIKNTSFEQGVIAKAKNFYLNNEKTPAYLEPDGADFLSPSLEIADLMRRVLPQDEFVKWLNAFYEKRSIDNIVKMPVVSDRTDMQIVHLDGLSLSRAWCMKGIAKSLPAKHKYKQLFEHTAETFLKTALPNVTSGNYGGDHWLASFAVYAIFAN